MSQQASPLQPGQQPTPQQIAQMQQQFAAEAARQGLTPQQFAEKLKAQAAAQQQQQAQQQQEQMQQQGQQMQPTQPGPPTPEAIALAKFLKSQELKSRTCIFEGNRKELFKVKRAIRALHSPAYEKARTKNPILPAVTDRASAENTFKLLPRSMLALRVSKFDPATNPPHGEPGHVHGAEEGEGAAGKKKKGQKGLWTVKIEPQQDAADECYYVWFYEGAQWRQKIYAGLALIAILAVVLFPLWPYTLRIGVWYVSMGALGLLAAFFGLAVVRLILFLVTIMAVPPGIWLYPNLFEDVGFFDSFRPVWAWRETKESLAIKKADKKAKKLQKAERRAAKANGTTVPTPTKVDSKPGTTGAQPTSGTVSERRNLKASVEEADDE